jgi:hypothetical protein
MKKKINKISMIVVATLMFVGALFFSVEQKDDGKWTFAAVSTFAQGETPTGYQSVIITDMGSSYTCDPPTLYKVQSYSSVCLGLGQGTLGCPGSFQIMTPAGPCEHA